MKIIAIYSFGYDHIDVVSVASPFATCRTLSMSLSEPRMHHHRAMGQHSDAIRVQQQSTVAFRWRVSVVAYRFADRISAAHTSADVSALARARRSGTISMSSMPGIDWYVSFLYFGIVRFGMWDAILAEPAPDPKLRGLTGGYAYAETVALAAKRRTDEAKGSLADLERIANAAGPDGLNAAKDVFAVAVVIARARLAGAEGCDTDAVDPLIHAAALEDQLPYV